ncbi:ASKHA domain-containing protein, partial [Candidatus Bipolaricaulota bacterium]
ELHDAVIEGLNVLIRRSTEQSSVTPDSIYGVTVVGNPTMLHLFLSINPIGIDVAPYAPKFVHSVRTNADTVGLAVNSCAVVQVLPAVSAYVGADIIAGIIATGLHEAEDCVLFLDVGTNGEIVLAMDGRLIACSTAAGPAFEGASLVQGMPALHGAIESVHIQGGKIQCDVIGDSVATGICGTGLLSSVAECLRIGAIDSSGRICNTGSPLADHIDGLGNTSRIRLTDGREPVYLHQRDIREFQLAKAAIRTGIEVLLQHADLRTQDLDRILIGGAFSARISSEHLIETGLLPSVDPLKIQVVGNVAGQGAQRVLLNRDLLEEAERLSERMEYLELSGDVRFTELFVDSIPFPPTT